ncbi:MFS transporter [Nonomuraea bangladeshensis]|uniref:MFS transporter n=1 Tax=Nonomuraea bangladeshensis TaxID=404385 RepID=UPI0031D2FE12
MTSVPPSVSTSPIAAAPTRRKVVVATGVGQVIEWFDWTLYAAFAPFFADRFFPAEGSGTGLLAAFGVYAIGFLFRPLGGVLFGYLADRFGRTLMFNITIVMMAAGSLIIAVLPTYDQIGVAAPLLLLLARIVQGLSAGGEMPASTALITEAVPAERRAFYSSVIFVGTGIGVLLGSVLGWALTGLLSAEAMASYGWRIAFAVGAVVGLYALVLRRSIHVPAPAPAAGQARLDRAGVTRNFADLFRTHPRGVLRIIGVGIGGTVGFYTLTVYMPTYLTRQTGLDAPTAFMVNCVILVVYSALMPVAGLLADRYGRRPVMGWSALALAVATVPAAHALSGSAVVALAALLPLIVLITGFHGPFPALMSEQFTPELRGLGVGLAYSLVTALFGGTATYLATWLAGTGRPMWYFVYVALAFLLAAVCFFAMPETAERRRRG